jgi:P-type E1-E2 ATPase
MLEEISVLPGRVRLKCNKLLKNKALSKFINAYVDSLYGIKNSFVNYTTATILFEYDIKKTNYTILRQNIENAVLTAANQKSIGFPQYGEYFEMLDRRDRAKRHFLLYGLIYFTLKLKHSTLGKFSLSSNIQVLQLASAVTVIGGYPLLKGIYRKFAKNVPADSDILLSLVALSFTLLRESSKGVLVLALKSFNDYVKFAADAESKRLLDQNIGKSAGMAWVTSGADSEMLISSHSLKPEDIIVVHTGEIIPAGGKILEGRALVNTLYFTGQPLIKQLKTGNAVHEGMSLLTGSLKIRVEKRTLEWKKPESYSKGITLNNKVLRYQQKITPVAITAAAAGLLLRGSVLHALSVILVLSPAAAGTALSTGKKSHIAALNKNGIFLRNPDLLEKIKDVKHIVFDKTGTLTNGTMKIIRIKSWHAAYTERRLLELCAACEVDSYHPISAAIREMTGLFDADKLESSVYLPSLGIAAEYGGKKVILGNMRLLRQNRVDVSRSIAEYKDCEEKLLTPVLIAIDGKLAGMIVLKDAARNDSKKLIALLEEKGYGSIALISGDSCDKAAAFAAELGIKHAFGNCSEIDKKVILSNYKKSGIVLMVGDGINDLPAMQAADISVCFANTGCDKVKLNCDCVIFDDHLERLADMLSISKKSYVLINQSINASCLYNSLFGIMAFLGHIDAFAAKSINTFNSMMVLLLNKRIEYL